MAEIFISYERKRRKAAEHLAVILRCYGYSVWFDYNLLKGVDFVFQIDAKIREAKAVIVLWCTKSVKSRWVVEEAGLAHELGSLVPVKIEACELPVGFRRLDYLDLADWNGAPLDHNLYRLLDELEQKTGRPPSLNLKAVRAYEEAWRRFGAPSLKEFTLEKAPAIPNDDRKLKEKKPRRPAEARIKVRNVIAHGAPEGRFLPGAGKTEWFQDAEDGPEMVIVPAGSFMMGSPETENEGPRHKVTINRPFAVGRFAITRDQFAAFISATGYETEGGTRVWNGKEWKLAFEKSWRDPGFAQDGNHPAVCVNWDDAKAYVAWLNDGMAAEPYRLLSEAEWEYVCRAGTATPFSWGSSITHKKANYGYRYFYGQKTVPVESFRPNPWGVWQMHGNVWEWCEDCWNESYVGAPDDGSAWTDGNCANRLLRGGSWKTGQTTLQAAYRLKGTAANRYSNRGIRVARTLPAD